MSAHDATPLVEALRDPASTAALDAKGWNDLISIARAEVLLGTLAHRLDGIDVPAAVKVVLDDAMVTAEAQRRQALWEAECAARALADYRGKVVLMKGTAYHALDLEAAKGRHVGDLDIMVAREDIQSVEALLKQAGWLPLKEDAYDDHYYREWMHELPPMMHPARDRMIDVHHTILPLTARITPDAAAMLKAAVGVGGETSAVNIAPGKLADGARLYTFGPAGMILHSVAHLFADGDMAGGLRNLWDIDRMLREFAELPAFDHSLQLRAKRHGLEAHLKRAMRIAQRIYGTPIDAHYAGRGTWSDGLIVRRMLARNGRGQETHKLLRFGFYLRSHWLRMPPLMLARHLWTKWRKGA